MLSQRATCVNIPPIFEVGINIGAEGYVRKHSTNIWSMNEYWCRELRA